MELSKKVDENANKIHNEGKGPDLLMTLLNMQKDQRKY